MDEVVGEDPLETRYSTPEEVAEALGLPPEYGGDNYGFMRFSETTVPTYDYVCRLIRSNEDVIDRRLRRSWRIHRVKDKVCTINTYWHDANAWRVEYYQRGGNYIQLRKDVLPWDPQQGDKLEIRVRGNAWRDITFAPNDTHGTQYDPDSRSRISFWFDYESGRLFLRTGVFQIPYNSVRISYRYGSDEDPPEAIRRLCSLMTASQVINMQTFAIKVGSGGDISGVKQDLLRMWQEEMNQIWITYQRSGSVHSVYG